ncbi:hypothetical protein F5I97DRAFT_1869593 [Phlebopus sp. FC_14]|nr:hypothetical protein F5I97DRAFT_1869593 [Phlebopus sp. FC_14]
MPADGLSSSDRSSPAILPVAPPKALVRSDIWFEDGNVVLIAGSAAFKVHRGQLERHSEVFRDLFSVPQPVVDESENVVDGCPTVDLYDCPSDIYYLLAALYDGLYFPKHQASDFSAVAGVLRLSTKYFIEHLRQRCLTRLELDWPFTLAEWDRREAEATDASGRYVPRESFAHPILAINLALELGLPDFLPSAFYDLSRYGPSKILCGARAFTPIFSSADTCSIHSDDTESQLPLVQLSHDSLYRTLRGREHAQLYVHTFLSHALKDRPSPSCLHSAKATSARCRESFYFIHLNVLRSVGGIACGRDADPLYTLTQAVDMLERKDFSDGVKQCGLKMCVACKREFEEVVGRAREEVWNLIPKWFGMDETKDDLPSV